MKKFSLMMIALFACASLFAESYNNNNDSSCPSACPCPESRPACPCPEEACPCPEACPEPCPPLPPCCELPPAPTVAAYNAPARINVCGSWDFFIEGAFIYWLTYEEGLFIGTFTPSTPATDAAQMIDFDYKLKPGFKVAIGGNSDCDDWSLKLQYTWYHFTINNTYNVPTTGTYSPFLSTSVTSAFTISKDRWNFRFDMLDLDLYRLYYNGKKLTFKTIYGLKGGWFRQTWSEDLTTSDINSRYHQKSWLIGPKVGINTNWMFGCGFSFFGNAAAALTYQKFSTVSFTNETLTGTINSNANYDFSLITPSAEAMLGFDYGAYFDRNNWHFDILVGYEIQYYFNENMFSSTAVHKSPQDIMMHGLNVTVRFDF